MNTNIYFHEKKYLLPSKEIHNEDFYSFRSSMRKVVPFPTSEFFTYILP